MSAVAVKPQRTAQISPDRWIVGIFAVVLVSVIMIASMAFSYVAIAEAGAWAGVPGLGWIAPIFIDGAIIAYTVSLSVFEARRAPKRTIRFSRSVLWGFSLLSVVLNFAHTASFWAWDFTQREAWFGCLIAVSAPIAALLSAEEAVRLVFKRMADVPSIEADHPVQFSASVPQAADVAAGEPEVGAAPATDEPDADVAPEPAHVEPGDLEDIVTVAEGILHDAEEAPAAHDGIVRYPARGEFVTAGLIGDMATDIDHPL